MTTWTFGTVENFSDTELLVPILGNGSVDQQINFNINLGDKRSDALHLRLSGRHYNGNDGVFLRVHEDNSTIRNLILDLNTQWAANIEGNTYFTHTMPGWVNFEKPLDELCDFLLWIPVTQHNRIQVPIKIRGFNGQPYGIDADDFVKLINSNMFSKASVSLIMQDVVYHISNDIMYFRYEIYALELL